MSINTDVINNTENLCVTIEEGDEETELKTMYSFSLQSRQELDTIKTIMDNAYSDEDEDLEDLLGSLGISLN